MNVTQPGALHYGQVWRSTNNRFYWIMTKHSSRPEIWTAMDVESGVTRYFYAKTMQDTVNEKNKLTRVYGHMRTPAIVPNHLSMGYQKGVNTPIIARLNRGLLRTFSGNLIKAAEISDPRPTKVAHKRVQPSYDTEHQMWSRPLAEIGDDLNLIESQRVGLVGGMAGVVVGVYPTNPWKYHVRLLGTNVVRTYRPDGTDLGGRPGIVEIMPKPVPHN